MIIRDSNFSKKDPLSLETSLDVILRRSTLILCTFLTGHLKKGIYYSK